MEISKTFEKELFELADVLSISSGHTVAQTTLSRLNMQATARQRPLAIDIQEYRNNVILREKMMRQEYCSLSVPPVSGDV